MLEKHEKFMKEALKQAKIAASLDEVPVGAVITKDDEIIAVGHNLRESEQNPLYHAEIIAINNAAEKLGTWRLSDCTLYVTLEPCAMCAGAIINARIPMLVYGASDPKGGVINSVMNLYEIKEFNHHPEVIGGVLAKEGGEIISKFFKRKRKTE